MSNFLARLFRKTLEPLPVEPAYKRNFAKTPEQDRAARLKGAETLRKRNAEKRAKKLEASK